MTLKDIETQLLALAPTEKLQIIQLLTQSLESAWRGIEKTPGVCGGHACIAQTRIPIWGLVNARRLGYSDADLLNNYPTLTALDLANAWIYAAVYPEEVEGAIQANEDE